MMKKVLLFSAFLVLFLFSYSYCENYDYGDLSSQTLTSKAWAAFAEKNYDAVNAFSEKCSSLYGQKALEQQAALTAFPPKEKAPDFWALNDVATCLFIKAKASKEQGRDEDAKKAAGDIITSYSYAQCWDPKGWFWSVAKAAKDEILVMEKSLDFGDYTSEALTGKAWKSFGEAKYDDAITYAQKCIELYSSEADKMQKNLTGYALKEKAFDNWALNDVGTCFFIMGESYLGKKDYKSALQAYQTLADSYSYSQCWDPKIDNFWKPAVGARGKINKIRAEQQGNL